ncbi:hypothetical protein LIER_06753 [Lithospermum erythrorhizon]|uniref:Uncharacterized protein n=1 Tax=Lithospermum erythrorhizon TaxID=34254 RepID=A0AAV3P5Q4_LITER
MGSPQPDLPEANQPQLLIADRRPIFDEGKQAFPAPHIITLLEDVLKSLPILPTKETHILNVQNRISHTCDQVHYQRNQLNWKPNCEHDILQKNPIQRLAMLFQIILDTTLHNEIERNCAMNSGD